MKLIEEQNQYTRIAKLDNGKLVQYDAAGDSDSNYFNNDKFEYLGQGVIHSINGIKQQGKEKRYFFAKVTK